MSQQKTSFSTSTKTQNFCHAQRQNPLTALQPRCFSCPSKHKWTCYLPLATSCFTTCVSKSMQQNLAKLKPGREVCCWDKRCRKVTHVIESVIRGSLRLQKPHGGRYITMPGCTFPQNWVSKRYVQKALLESNVLALAITLSTPFRPCSWRRRAKT